MTVRASALKRARLAAQPEQPIAPLEKERTGSSLPEAQSELSSQVSCQQGAP